MGHLSLLAMLAVLPVGVALVVGIRSLAESRGVARAVGMVTLVVATSVAVFAVAEIAAPPADIAVGELTVDGPALEVPPARGVRALVAVTRVHFEDNEHPSEGTYHLAVNQGAQHTTIDGRAEQHFVRRRVGRKGHTNALVSHVDHHHALPVDVDVGSSLALLDVEGPLAPTMSVRIHEAPPASAFVVGALSALMILEAVSQRHSRRHVFLTSTSVVGAVVAYSAAFLNGSGEPGVSWVMVFVPLSLVAGTLVAFMLGKVLLSTSPKATRPRAAAIEVRRG